MTQQEAEEILKEIIKKILDSDEEINIHDHFLDIGGNSLSAIELECRISEQFEIELDLYEMYERLTIFELAEYIVNIESTNQGRTTIAPVEAKDFYPTTSPQKRMYILQNLEPDSTAYNISAAFDLEGSLDRSKLEKSLNQLIERHETFRTSFEIVGVEVMQKINPNTSFHLNLINLGKEDHVDVKTIINSSIKPFDLSRDPLFRATLVHLSEKKHILVFDMHHIISDGISLSILFRDFLCLYKGQELEPMNIQYKDYAAWQSNTNNNEKIKAKEEFWLNTYKTVPPELNLPYDFPRPVGQLLKGERIDFSLDQKVTKGLKNLCKETGCTMYMVILSIINILLAKYSGEEDIVIGSPVGGRVQRGLENVIGMFVNTLALRNNPTDDKSFIHFLKEVKEHSLKAFENQEYQFDELITKLKIKREGNRNPLFNVMFSMENMRIYKEAVEDLKIEPYQHDTYASQFDLVFTAVETDDSILFRINYAVDLFRKETI